MILFLSYLFFIFVFLSSCNVHVCSCCIANAVQATHPIYVAESSKNKTNTKNRGKNTKTTNTDQQNRKKKTPTKQLCANKTIKENVRTKKKKTKTKQTNQERSDQNVNERHDDKRDRPSVGPGVQQVRSRDRGRDQHVYILHSIQNVCLFVTVVRRQLFSLSPILI